VFPDFRLPILVGPTGVGKSEVAFHLAVKLKADILSADAFQVYKGMEVGTAQPPLEWRKKVKHHLVGVRDPAQSWNAVEFAREARNILAEREKGRKFLVVGGAGFYVKALVEGGPEGRPPGEESRREVAQKVEKLGNRKAHEWLAEIDPAAGKRIHVNDTKRIRRALERVLEDGEGVPVGYDPLGAANVLFIGLERSRENLDRALRARTEKMWDNGLLDEALALSKGLPKESPVWGAIGYAEALEFLQSRLGREEALERTFRRTRQYAKRQWTWFKHQHRVHWVDLDLFQDLPSAAETVRVMILQKS
jgi:tRNA dimethylallyltransferase